MVNTRKIKGRMMELRITQKEMANSLGLSQATVNQKINNVRPMGLIEAEKMTEILNISSEEFPIYFFCK